MHKSANVSTALVSHKELPRLICVNCIEVPNEFREMLKNQRESMIDTYKREIKACENIIMMQKDNESKLISGLKKLNENQKAANQEKDLVSLFERRFNELEKKIALFVQSLMMLLSNVFTSILVKNLMFKSTPASLISSRTNRRYRIRAFCSALLFWNCLLYTSPSPRDATLSRMPSSA